MFTLVKHTFCILDYIFKKSQITNFIAIPAHIYTPNTLKMYNRFARKPNFLRIARLSFCQHPVVRQYSWVFNCTKKERKNERRREGGRITGLMCHLQANWQSDWLAYCLLRILNLLADSLKSWLIHPFCHPKALILLLLRWSFYIICLIHKHPHTNYR